MKCNIGDMDRNIRFAAAVIILGLGAFFQSWWGLIGLIPLATGFFRICPAYSLIGFKSGCCNKEGGAEKSSCDSKDGDSNKPSCCH